MLKFNIRQSIFYILFSIIHITICSQTLIKRDLNDPQHDIKMLHRLLLHRNTSTVLSDCTINMNIDGIYSLPQENTLASKLIQLVEYTFNDEIYALKRTGDKLRQKLNQNSYSYSFEKFRQDFNFDLKILVASQEHIQEVHLRYISMDNGGSDVLRYKRMNSSKLTIIDYEFIVDDIIQKDTILQTFTISNIRETLNNDPQKTLTNNGWWIGPVFCERNPSEAFIMTHIYPLPNG